MNRKMYREIAKKYGVSIDEVKRDMQEAINQAYIKPNPCACGIPRKKEIPTTDEFIAYVSRQLQS